MKKITIGIPAHNEEANISHLLDDILRQEDIATYIQNIIVVADGCTDNTITEVNKNRNSLIKLVIKKKRAGLAKTLQTIFELSETDVLVVINADAHIIDPHFITKLTQPIMKGTADLTSTKLVEVNPHNYFEKIIYTGLAMKSQIVQSWKKGNNVLTCYGVARAFSKRLYKSIVIPTSIGDDAYTYFYAMTHNYRYVFVRNTEIFYRPSGNYSDHRLQTLRFFKSKEIMQKEFGYKFVNMNYKVPKNIIIYHLLVSLIRSPLPTVLYLATILGSKILSFFFYIENTDYWNISKSSKKLHILP